MHLTATGCPPWLDGILDRCPANRQAFALMVPPVVVIRLRHGNPALPASFPPLLDLHAAGTARDAPASGQVPTAPRPSPDRMGTAW